MSDIPDPIRQIFRDMGFEIIEPAVLHSPESLGRVEPGTEHVHLTGAPGDYATMAQCAEVFAQNGYEIRETKESEFVRVGTVLVEHWSGLWHWPDRTKQDG